ncbi:hypothetical protein D3C79_1086630 [compost metagenome]
MQLCVFHFREQLARDFTSNIADRKPEQVPVGDGQTSGPFITDQLDANRDMLAFLPVKV